MGLFDKRDKKPKKDDFDSPVENIDLSATPETGLDEPPPPEVIITREADPEPEYDSSFGIDKAIELMRTLPADNIELVVQVVKLTLESTKIKISNIIEDATTRQEDIQGRIKVLKGEIADFEKEIQTRQAEITGLEADFAETSTVKERLQLAEKVTKKGAVSRVTSSGGKDKAAVAGTTGSSSGKHPVARPSGSPGTGPLGKPKTTVVAKK